MNRSEMLQEMRDIAGIFESGNVSTEDFDQLRARFEELDSQIDDAPDTRTPGDIAHRGGTPWHDAPKPRRLHRCRVQTSGWVGFTFYERCACGAVRMDRRAWFDRNTR